MTDSAANLGAGCRVFVAPFGSLGLVPMQVCVCGKFCKELPTRLFNTMEFDTSSKLSLKEAKRLFVGLTFLAHVQDFYSEDFAITKFGKDYEKFKIKVRIADVIVFDRAEDLRFELKILSINDVIKGFSLKEVLKFLGAKTPKSFVRLHEQLVGPIPEPLPLPEPQMKISFPTPESKEEEEKINCAKGAIEKVLALPAPKKSDLARKRVIPESTPGTGKKKVANLLSIKKAQASLVTVTAQDRVDEFPNEHFTVRNNGLFCLACRAPQSVKRLHLLDHISSITHMKGKERINRSKKSDLELFDFLKGNITDENAAAFTKTRNVDLQLFNIKFLDMLLCNAIPVKKADGMRDFIEETGLQLTSSPHLRLMIPSLVDKELQVIVRPLTEQQIPYSVIFDGTTRVCEAFGVVLRWVFDYEIFQHLVNLSLLAMAMTANDTTRQMAIVLMQQLGLNPAINLGFSHDRASVNTLAMETLGVIYYHAEDWGCIPHTLDHVGDHFEHQHLDHFWHLWINVFSYGAKIAQDSYRAVAGHAHLTYCTTRWWSKFDCFEQIGIDWAIIIPAVLE